MSNVSNKITLKDVKDILIDRYDECDIIDLLGLTSQDIVVAFSSVIQEKMEYILGEIEVLSEGYLEDDDITSLEEFQDFAEYRGD